MEPVRLTSRVIEVEVFRSGARVVRAPALPEGPWPEEVFVSGLPWPADVRVLLVLPEPGAPLETSGEKERARRDSRSARVSVRALVGQRSGEAWSGVAPSLSTADRHQEAELSELPSLRIGRRQAVASPPAWRPLPEGYEELFSGLDAAASLEPPEPREPPRPAPREARRRGQDTGDFAAVSETTSKSKRASRAEPVEVPPAVFAPAPLEPPPPPAQALPPVPASPPRAMAAMPAPARSAGLLSSMGFGLGDRMRAEEAHGMLGGGTTLDHRVTIEVASRLPDPTEVEVRERVPVKEETDKAVEVVVSDVSPPWVDFDQAPAAPIRGGKRWRFTLAAGEARTLSFRYRVKIDGKDELFGGNRREPA